MHQLSKHANIKLTKHTTKVNNKVPVILPENDIHCLETHCQVHWTTAESDLA